MIFLLALFFCLASAGEVGLRLETPDSRGSLWLTETWEISLLSLSGRMELSLFPLRFQTAGLKLSSSLGPLSGALELSALGTGRTDLFLSGIAKGSVRAGDFTLLGQVGVKFGWVALNLSPSTIFLAWAVVGMEKDDFSGEAYVSGPSPWEPSLKLRYGPLSVVLSSSVSSEVTAGSGPWGLTSSFQIWPKPSQTQTLAYSAEGKSLRAWLSSTGNFGLRISISEGDWVASASFFFLWGRMTRLGAEVTRAF